MAHILVVDDEEGVVDLFTAALEHMGHTVLTASNGKHALDVFPESGVHLVITDINMPEMDGFELISELLKRYPDQKILAVSGAGREGFQGSLKTARHLGASGCLEKPFELKTFYKHVEELLS